jgi:hypothetical protein
VLGTVEAASRSYRDLAAPFLGVRPFCPKLIQLSNWDFLRQPLFIDVIAAAHAMERHFEMLSLRLAMSRPFARSGPQSWVPGGGLLRGRPQCLAARGAEDQSR